MSDTKLTGLTAQTTVDADDLLYAVDVSDTTMAPSGTSKKATRGLLQTYNAGTLTTDKKVLDLSATWNAAGVTFTGIKANFTDTASAAGSLLMDLQVGGVSRFSFKKDGQATINEIVLTRQRSASNTANGLYFSSTVFFIAAESQHVAGFWGEGVVINNNNANNSISWNNGLLNAIPGANTDLRLFRDAADTLAQRRTTNAQTFRVYGTFTDASNYVRASLAATGSAVTLAAQTAGTGDDNITLNLTAAGTGTVTSTSVFTAPNLANGRTIQRFTPLDNQPPASNFATLDTRNSVAVLDFDAATDESAIFVGYISQAATLTSGIKVIISWSATSATSGDCVWAAQFEKTTGQDIDSDGFDTATTATTTTSGTSGVVNTTTITCTTIDSLAAGDCFRLKIYRDADAGGDTMTGDAELVAVELQQVA